MPRRIRHDKDYNYAAVVLDTGARERLDRGEPLTRNVNLNSDSAISKIGTYWHAVRMYIHGSGTEKNPEGKYPPGTTEFLEKFKNEYGDKTKPGSPVIIEIEEETFELETDLEQIRDYADKGLFQEGEELDLDNTISSSPND